MTVKCPWCPHAVDEHGGGCRRCDCEAQMLTEEARQYAADVEDTERNWQQVGKPVYEGLRARFPVDMEGK